ncbi:Uncharacterised protein [Mycobacterium tuberculosis]|nr:Uncharacterised protein [Mycobacterium tuberculosis]
MVPPRSPPSRISTCSAMVAMTGSAVSGSNSLDEAPAIPATSRAYSMTMHCRPRHRPRVGMPCSRANFRAPSLPSMPRMPKPPGTQMPSSSASCSCAPSGVSQRSDGIQRMLTLVSCAKPPALRASVTDR